MGLKRAVLIFALAFLSSTSLFSAIFPVTNVGDLGGGSLREAINQANLNPGPDIITFTMAIAGVKTITLNSDLPTITESLFIDGGSDPFYAGQPLIELNGNNAVLAGLRFDPTANDSHVHGLIINRTTGDGIFVQNTDNLRITGCYIGTDAFGTLALANAAHGIQAQFATNLVIGGIGPNEGNLISGNTLSGLQLVLVNTATVLGNKIGTDVNGTGALPNSTGVNSFCENLTLGGITADHRNIISGNGIGISHEGENGNILGNFIGTDISGSLPLANLTAGLVIRGSNNQIGGILAGQGNIISGNGASGINISGPYVSQNIQGNHIGTDISGTLAIPNGSHGIELGGGSKRITIGGVTVAARNLISGNLGAGISTNNADSIYIYGNFIGTDINGTAALGNQSSGIALGLSKDCEIGNATLQGANTISGNGLHGIEINNPGTDNNLVKRNYIGTDATGLVNLANASRGISITGGATRTAIGGLLTAESNLIANNLQGGIEVNGGTSLLHSILGNSIYDHPVEGIRLIGGNNNQAAPVLTGFTDAPGTTTFFGTFNSTPNTTYRIEFFSSNTIDQGMTFLGFSDITTDATGFYALAEVLPVTISAAQPVISSTATDPLGNTSEFGTEIVLDAEIVDFSLTKLTEREVLLNWEVENGEDLAHFEIQHQQPGANFETIGKQESFELFNDTRAYEFGVPQLVPGTHHFRLVKVAIDGRRSFSPSLDMQIDLQEELQVWVENPIQETSVLTVFSEQEQAVQISLYDLQGTEVRKLFTGSLMAGIPQKVSLQELNAVSKGIYILFVEGNRNQYQQKLILNK